MAVRVPWSQAISPLYAVTQRDKPVQLPATSLLDRFAEHLAEHGDIALAAASIHVPVGTGRDLYNTICKRLGSQAR